MLGWIWRLIALLPLAICALTLIEAGEAVYRSGVAYGLVDPAGFARYRLYSASTARFTAEIEAAIAAGDYTYAEELYRLGVAYGHELPPDLGKAAEATWARRAYASSARAAGGFLFGTVGSGEEIAGAIASDLIGVGDMRDFSVQGFNYLAGREYDPFLLGFSALGIGLTAASYGSFGLASAPDAGLSLVKNAYRTKRLSRPLVAYFSGRATKLVDTAVLRRELAAAAGEGISGLGKVERAAAKSIDRTVARGLLDDAAVLDDMRRTSGLGAPVAALALADGPKDLRRLGRVAAHFGENGATVLKFLGKSVLRVTYALAEILHAAYALAAFLLTALIRWPLTVMLRGFVRWLGIGRLNANAIWALARIW